MAGNMGGRLLEPHRDANVNLMEGAACWMAGWGHDLVDQNNSNTTTGANSHPYLNESGVNAIGRDYCVAYAEPWVMDMSGPNDFCAGNPAVENGKFVTHQPNGCDDTGIPLICDDNGYASLVGIYRGISSDCMPETSVGISNVMVRVGQTDNYSWISTTMSENEPQPGYEDASLPMPSTMTCSRPSIDNSAKIFNNGDVELASTRAEVDRYTAIVEFAPDSSTNDVVSSTCYGAIISPYEVVVPAECCLNAFMTVQTVSSDIIGTVITGVSYENLNMHAATDCLEYNQIEKVDIHPNHIIIGAPTSQVQDNVCVVKVSENMFDMYEQQGKPNCAAAACLPSGPLPHGTACWVPVMVDDPNNPSDPNLRSRVSEGWNILGDAECNDFNIQMASIHPNTLGALTSGSQDEANLFCAAKPSPGVINMGDSISAGTDWKILDGKGSPMFCLESTPIGDRTVVAGLYYLNTLYKTGDQSATPDMHDDYRLMAPADFIDLSVLSARDFIPTANDAQNNADMSPLVSSVASYYPWNYEVGTGWEGFSTCEAQITGAAENPDWPQNLDPYRLTVQMGMVKLSFKIFYSIAHKRLSTFKFSDIRIKIKLLKAI